MRDADDDALTDEDGGVDLSRYLWQSEEEREAAYAAVAERQQQLNSARILADARRVSVPVVEDKPVKPRSAPGAANLTQDWMRTIDRRIASNQMALVEAVGLELADVRRALRTEVEALRGEVEALRGQLDVARRLDALEQRFARAEERDPPRVGLRAV